MRRLLLSAVFVLLSSSFLVAEDWSGPTFKTVNKEGLKYFLHAGFTVSVSLVNTIYSFNVLSPCIAETDYPIDFLGKTMLPAHTKFLGQCQIQKSGDRVNIVFNRVIFPDGSESSFEGIALELDGSAGLLGERKDMKAFKIPAKVILNSAAAAAGAVSNPTVTSEMVKNLSAETQTELSQQQEYAVVVKKGKGFMIYATNRFEY